MINVTEALGLLESEGYKIKGSHRLEAPNNKIVLDEQIQCALLLVVQEGYHIDNVNWS